MADSPPSPQASMQNSPRPGEKEMNEAFASGASLEMGSVRKAKSSTFSLAESLRQLAYDWKEGLGCIMGFGHYDYKWLCTPTLPLPGKVRKAPMFLGLYEKLPIVLAAMMGFQHCLAMLGGIITPPSLIASDGCFPWQYDGDLCGAKQYLISGSLMTSGILTTIQVTRSKIYKTNFFIGTGLISVTGTSFTFLPIAREYIVGEIRAGRSGYEAYGAFLGTVMVGALCEIAMSFIPPHHLRKVFPPVVTGTTISLIGMSLAGTGIKYWGGGVFCAENDMSRSASFGSPQLCTGNGEVVLGYGSWQYFALGSSVIVMLILIELFGSPFMRSSSVVISLLTGYIVSVIARYEDPVTGESLRYVTSDKIDEAPWITFLWVKTFPLGFAPQIIVPVCIAFLVSAVETIGDISASCEVSRVFEQDGFKGVLSRVQGGLLADGCNSLLAALMTTAPNTTFSQNNGVIALTRCASRAAGLSCAVFLFLFGVIGKFGGVVASIPDCVLGGMTTFLFANVIVSGITVLSKVPMTRRNRFILALSLGIGVAIAAEPQFVEGGGIAGYFGQNLKFTIGLWPTSEICSEFPTVTETFPDQCVLPDVTLINDASGTTYPVNITVAGGDLNGMTAGECAGLNGTFVASSTTSTTVYDCVDANGYCCEDYNENIKMWRDTVILIMKTPYCLGALIAIVLNLILPMEEEEDPVDVTKEEEEKEALKASQMAADLGPAPAPVS